ncbi:hypothetical protein AAZX31_05G032100 [Glycine max]|nr:hypothetical protein GLYMA_05G033301v4 [Glycine max]KAH1132606.1 hypothetical protein GYH30_011444 [Glycine max]
MANRWLRPEVYPCLQLLELLLGYAVCMQLVRNICINPDVRREEDEEELFHIF